MSLAPRPWTVALVPGLLLASMAPLAPGGARAAALAVVLALLAAAVALARRGHERRTEPWLDALLARVGPRLGAGLVAAAPLVAVAAWQVVRPTYAVGLGALVAAPGWALVGPALLAASPAAARRGAGLALLAGLALRALLVVAAPRGELFPDSPSYLTAAHAALAGAGFDLHPYRTPGYPAFYLATAGSLGLVAHRAAQALLLGPCLGLLLAAWARARGASDGAAATLTAAVVLCPLFLISELPLLTEPLFTAALALATLALCDGLRPREGHLGWLGAAGLGLGLATLVRPAGEAPIAVALAAALVRVRPLPRAALAAAVVAAGALVPLGPWLARNAAAHGAPRLSFMGGVQLLGSVAHLADVEDPDPDARALSARLRAYQAAGDLERMDQDALWTPGDGIVAVLTARHGDPLACDDAARGLARRAILRAPGRFAATVAWRLRGLLAYRPVPLQPEPPSPAAWDALPHQEVVRRLAPAREPSPDARRAVWRALDGVLRALDAALQPLVVLAPLGAVALAAAGLVRRRPSVDALVLVAVGLSLHLAAALAHPGEVRYTVPPLPLFALALVLCAAPRAAVSPDAAGRGP